MMDRIRCKCCGAESFTDGTRTQFACSRCYDAAIAALTLIRDFPIPEQDNMVAANMRAVARDALRASPAPETTAEREIVMRGALEEIAREEAHTTSRDLARRALAAAKEIEEG